eukprot:1367879-Amphidinium_carterae.1
MMDQRADDVVLEHILQRLERDEISVGDALGSLESEIQSTCPPPLASTRGQSPACLLYTSDAADDTPCVDL